MQLLINNQERKLGKAKEDQDKAVAKVTEQLNKKLAESNEKAGQGDRTVKSTDNKAEQE